MAKRDGGEKQTITAADVGTISAEELLGVPDVPRCDCPALPEPHRHLPSGPVALSLAELGD